ncbi:nucleotidyltransferase family protein [Streptomyces roseolus]|uniref:nucleotidyltransferase family protein n=1 Tax=Streptomyces roseolus TaxID=67358 RepID=UPI0036FD3D6E
MNLVEGAPAPEATAAGGRRPTDPVTGLGSGSGPRLAANPAGPDPGSGAGLASGSAGFAARTAGDQRGQEQELPPDHTQAILEVTKEVAAVLKSSGCAFALVGSVAAYAHGIPVRLQHDVDFAVRREDADQLTPLLSEQGIEIVEPPEDWLIKGRRSGEHIDLIFSLAGRPVTTELLERAETLPVDSVHMPVIHPTDLMVGRLAAFSEHHCDFGRLLPVARGLRERVDWDRVREETEDKPMAAAFLYLLERLDVIEPRPSDGEEPDA